MLDRQNDVERLDLLVWRFVAMIDRTHLLWRDLALLHTCHVLVFNFGLCAGNNVSMWLGRIWISDKLTFQAGVPRYGIPFGSSNIAWVSSKVLPAVSGKRKNAWIIITKLKIPNMMYTLYLIFAKAGGTNAPRTVLNAQLAEVESATALPLTLSG